MTSGESVGPFELESRIHEHPDVVEVVVIGKPDPLRGEIIIAFIVLKEGIVPTEEVAENIRTFVKIGLGADAEPTEIKFRNNLPKTKSGKIMRRVLKSSWEINIPVGDLSTSEE